MSWPSDLNYRLFEDVNTFARRTSWLHSTLVDYAKYGIVVFAVLLLVGLILSRRGSARTLAAAVWACVAVLLAVAINQPIVHAVNEARPYARHPSVLVLVSRSTDPSFPSDHATMAGAAAAGLLLVSVRLGLFTWLAALLLAFARVYVGAHYPWDVIAGLLLGSAVSLLGWLLIRVPLTHVAQWLRERGGLGRTLVSDRPDQAST